MTFLPPKRGKPRLDFHWHGICKWVHTWQYSVMFLLLCSLGSWIEITRIGKPATVHSLFVPSWVSHFVAVCSNEILWLADQHSSRFMYIPGSCSVGGDWWTFLDFLSERRAGTGINMFWRLGCTYCIRSTANSIAVSVELWRPRFASMRCRIFQIISSSDMVWLFECSAGLSCLKHPWVFCLGTFSKARCWSVRVSWLQVFRYHLGTVTIGHQLFGVEGVFLSMSYVVLLVAG